VAPGLPGVLQLEQKPHLDRRPRVSKARGPLEVVGARRPREVVHVFLVVAVRRRAVGVVAARSLHAGMPSGQPKGTVSDTSWAP
jgi:hypothetical protein